MMVLLIRYWKKSSRRFFRYRACVHGGKKRGFAVCRVA